MIYIADRLEYNFAVSLGHRPLMDWRNFELPIKLRLEIQRDLFGTADFKRANDKYYQWIWENKLHSCEETGQPLYNYSSVHVSHIISRGADRRMATDPRNCNLLTKTMHNKWESKRLKEMNVYPINQYIIGILKKDYNNL